MGLYTYLVNVVKIYECFVKTFIFCLCLFSTDYMNERPYFEEAVSKNVTGIAEDVAILKCRVKNKKNRTVRNFN